MVGQAAIWWIVTRRSRSREPPMVYVGVRIMSSTQATARPWAPSFDAGRRRLATRHFAGPVPGRRRPLRTYPVLRRADDRAARHHGDRTRLRLGGRGKAARPRAGSTPSFPDLPSWNARYVRASVRGSSASVSCCCPKSERYPSRAQRDYPLVAGFQALLSCFRSSFLDAYRSNAGL